jgi:hypothetical protein
VVPFDASHYFTVEARRKVGYDTPLPSEGVIIHDMTSAFAKPLFVDGDNDGDTADPEAIWTPGETYTTPNGVRITVNAVTAGGYSVTLRETLAPSLPGPLALTDPDTGSSTTTDGRTVAVSLPAATDDFGVTGYFVSQSGARPAAGAAAWQPAPPATFTLAGGNGLKTVYAWAKDAAGNVSARLKASITLNEDRRAPTAKLALKAVTNKRRLPIRASGGDAIGVAGWFVSENPDTPAAAAAGWKTKKPTAFNLSRPEGAKTVYLWTKDAAGNVSKRAQAKTFLDTKAPRPAITSPANRAKLAELRSIAGTVGDGAANTSSGLRRASLAILRRADCTWWNPRKGTHVAGKCGTPLWFSMKAGETWSAAVGNLDDPGEYVLYVRFFDRAGNAMRRWVVGVNLVRFGIGK